MDNDEGSGQSQVFISLSHADEKSTEPAWQAFFRSSLCKHLGGEQVYWDVKVEDIPENIWPKVVYELRAGQEWREWLDLMKPLDQQVQQETVQLLRQPHHGREQERLDQQTQRDQVQERGLWKLPDFFSFSDGFLRFVPRKHLERVYEPSKEEAEMDRLERFEKDGNEVAANREYCRQIREAVLMTLLTIPWFFISEIWGRVRRMVAR